MAETSTAVRSTNFFARFNELVCGFDLGHYWKRLANLEVECCKCGKVATPRYMRKLKRKGCPG